MIMLTENAVAAVKTVLSVPPDLDDAAPAVDIADLETAARRRAGLWFTRTSGSRMPATGE